MALAWVSMALAWFSQMGQRVKEDFASETIWLSDGFQMGFKCATNVFLWLEDVTVMVSYGFHGCMALKWLNHVALNKAMYMDFRLTMLCPRGTAIQLRFRLLN